MRKHKYLWYVEHICKDGVERTIGLPYSNKDEAYKFLERVSKVYEHSSVRRMLVDLPFYTCIKLYREGQSENYKYKFELESNEEASL